MKKCIFPLLVIIAVLFGLPREIFAQGTAFTYQGRLNDGANPASGTYDLQFALYDALSSGVQQGVLVTNAAVGVTNGLFTVTLDFGSQFPGAARWLEIAVRTNGAATFTTLAPRQKLAPTPYAITASNLSGTLPVAQLSGQLSGVQIANGAVGAAQIDTTAVQARVTGSAPAGQFITGINADGTVTVAADATDWKLTGNNVSPGQFFGSTNNQAVELKANGQRVLRLEPGNNGAPNVVAGSSVNYAAPGLSGVVIAGGGSTNIGGAVYSNTVQASYANIGGGAGNTIEAGASAATIGGGLLNDMQYGALSSVIGGGSDNLIQTNSDSAVIGGGQANGIHPEAWGSVIAGGEFNHIYETAHQSVISGGNQNIIASNSIQSVVSGGAQNSIQNDSVGATIGGGQSQTIEAGAGYSTIAGGSQNLIQSNAYQSTISGGLANHVESDAINSAIGGGSQNFIKQGAYDGFIGGGEQNVIQDQAGLAVIAGGVANRIQTNSSGSAIGGGSGNLIQPNNSYSTIAGGSGNTSVGAYGVVAGGDGNVAGQNSFAAGHRAKAVATGTFVWADAQNADFTSTGTNQFLIRAAGGIGINTNNPNGAALSVAGTVVASTFQSANFSGNGGGLTNVDAPTLGGLASSNFWQLGGNTVAAGQALGSANYQPLELIAGNQRAMRLEYGGIDSPNVIGGSSLNLVSNGVTSATIAGGGRTYTIFSSTFHDPNVIGGNLGTIGGGALNTIGTNSGATIGGGYNNQALALDSVISGGAGNRIESAASFATIAGGASNTNSGSYATVAGGQLNLAGGDYSLAAGRRAKANHSGTFVWADAQNADFASTAGNQVILRASGGVGINTNNPGATLDVNGSLRVGNGTTVFNNLQGGIAQMASGSSTVKTNFTFTFPKAFTTVPNVVVSARSGNIVPVDDTFAVSVRDVTATTCTVNIVRVDNPSGWSQQVKINWIAWE